MSQENKNEDALFESNSKENSGSDAQRKPYAVTMELPLFLMHMGMTLSGTALSNIVLYRTCVHALNHPVEECRAFLTPEKNNDTSGIEVEVQKYATFVTTTRTVIESFVPAILAMLLAVWSNTHGRKPLLVWPLLGLTLTAILNVGFGMFEGLGPWWYLLPVVPFSISGGFISIYTGAFCYLSDITTIKSRSLRMTVMETSIFAGSVTGALASSHLLKAAGSVNLLLVVAALNLVAWAFTSFRIKESVKGAVKGNISTVLDISLAKQMFRDSFKRRPNRIREQLLLLTLTNSLSIFVQYGSNALSYMYTRQKLNWALKDYTQYSAVSTTLSFVGSLFGVAVIQKYLHLEDLPFSIVAFVSAMVEYLIRGFATHTWHMYLGTAIAIFSTLSAPLTRSFMSKILPSEDISKVFALMSAIQALCPLLAPLLYNVLYTATISTFPGAFWIMSAGIYFACTVLTGLVAYIRAKTESASGYTEPQRINTSKII